MVRNKIIHLCILIFGIVVPSLGHTALEPQEPSYSEICTNKARRSTWNFPGLAPYGCDAKHYGDTERVAFIYKDFIVHQNGLLEKKEFKGSTRTVLSTQGEEHLYQYMSHTVALVKAVSRGYYLEQNSHRDVSNEEVEAFVLSVLAMAQTESNYTHYRYIIDPKENPENMKFFVGDLAKCMVQIYAEQHGIQNSKTYFDLVECLNFGIDYYHRFWQSIVGRGCPASGGETIKVAETDYELRGRAAYSAYNGGPGQLCRWARMEGRKAYWENKYPDCHYGQVSFKDEATKELCEKSINGKTWRIDMDYLENRRNKPWEDFITSKSVNWGFDLQCLLEGRDLCVIGEDRYSQYFSEKIILLKDQELVLGLCVMTDKGDLECVHEEGDLACLNAYEKIKDYSYVQPADIADLRVQPNFKHVRNKICKDAVSGLVPVGELISIQKNIKLRKGPGTGFNDLGQVSSGNLFQVLDFKIRPREDHSRWYKIHLKNGKKGFIFGGNNKNHKSWIRPVNFNKYQSSELYIPIQGTTIRVVNPEGIKIYNQISDIPFVGNDQKTCSYEDVESDMFLDFFKPTSISSLSHLMDADFKWVDEDSTVIVKDVIYKGDNQNIFLKVIPPTGVFVNEAPPPVGYIYFGRVKPSLEMRKDLKMEDFNE